MTTITQFDTSRAAIGSIGAGGTQEERLAKAARAMTNAEPGFSRSEFLSDVAPHDAQRLFEWSEILKDNRGWLQRVLNPALDGSAAELTETTRAVFEVLARHGVGAIALHGFDPAPVNGMHLAMVLRATADELEGDPRWQRALVRARAALDAAGVNPSEALYGLLKPE